MTKVDLITGFLGSGKTTFIKEYADYLVRRGENVAIIVNDYGAINVDRLLLGEALGDKCHLEMVIGGDADCTRRRLKTKLISMAMNKYSYVIVEPSGVFDVDDFLDMLYEEPLERWYEMSNIITLVEADLDKGMSDKARYVMTSEVAKAGTVVLSKVEPVCQERKIDEASLQNEIVDYLNEGLEMFNSRRRLKDVYLWKSGKISDDDFKVISSSRYSSGEMTKLPLSEGDFDSYFYFHVETDISKIEETIASIFKDPNVGNVIRIKGFLQQDNGEWLEVNATKNSIRLEPISTGQELFIVIGESINFKKLGEYWKSYRNGL